MNGLRNLWENFCDAPLVLTVIFWALWFGLGVLAGAAVAS